MGFYYSNSHSLAREWPATLIHYVSEFYSTQKKKKKSKNTAQFCGKPKQSLPGLPGRLQGIINILSGTQDGILETSTVNKNIMRATYVT